MPETPFALRTQFQREPECRARVAAPVFLEVGLIERGWWPGLLGVGAGRGRCARFAGSWVSGSVVGPFSWKSALSRAVGGPVCWELGRGGEGEPALLEVGCRARLSARFPGG